MKNILGKSLILLLSAVAIFSLAPTNLMADKPDFTPGKPEILPPESPPANPFQTPPGKNHAPVANAGMDQNDVVLGKTVILDGSASSDPDGDTLVYTWSMITRPAESGATLSNTTAKKPTFTVDEVGSYTIQLIVDDGRVYSLPDSVIVIAVTNPCIAHNGTEYCEVISPYTGKVWLDRNLGAAQVCTSLYDVACYGDYYQWGRNADGHEDYLSEVTEEQATDINNAGIYFIVNPTAITDPEPPNNGDWADAADGDGSLRSVNWLRTDGGSVCPRGFRVPTIDELCAELLDEDGDFNNFLKLPISGKRSLTSGRLLSLEYRGGVWSSTIAPREGISFLLDFYEGYMAQSEDYRGHGRPVRCLRD